METLTDEQTAGQLDELIAVGGQSVRQGLAQGSGGTVRVLGQDVTRLSATYRSGPTPSSEWKLHSAIYATRPDARAVIHLHPQYSLLLTALGKKIRFLTQDNAFYVGSYGQTKYYTNGSDELAETAAAELADGRHDVVVLGNHGIAACGTSVESAFRTALNFEEAALMTYRALLLGDEDTVFPPEELAILKHH